MLEPVDPDAMLDDGGRGSVAFVLSAFAFLLALLAPASAKALTLQAPIGGDAFTLPSDAVLCGGPPTGWSVDGTRKRARPPSDPALGKAAPATIAPNLAACGTPAAQTVTLIGTGPIPTIEPQSVVVFLDAGRLEVRGESLEGIELSYQAGKKAGSDTCLSVGKEKGRDACAVNIDRGLPADPVGIVFRWSPARGRTGADVVTYDEKGNVVSEDEMHLPIAKMVLSQLLSPARTVDVSRGEGRVELVHAEAVSSVECGAARCAVTGSAVLVRGVPAASATVPIRLRLRPRVFVSHGEALDVTLADTLSVLRCPLSFVSGPPLRNVDDTRVLVRLDPACGSDVSGIRWTVSGEAATAKRVETLNDGVYVLLWIGRIPTEQITLVATRADDGSVLAVTSSQTVEAPPLRSALALPGFGEIDFIPKNRDAVLSLPPLVGDGRLVPLAIPGAYSVKLERDGPHLRGEPSAGGYAAIRFSYRIPSVPEPFRETSFAVLVDPLQRPIRDASVPAPLGASSVGAAPILELRCTGRNGKVTTIPPGTSPHIPFSARDSCRLVIHRERIPVDSGEQHVDIDVTVTTLGGDKSDASTSHHLVLRHGEGPDVIWIRGAMHQFDHIKVNATHVIDESRYTSTGGKVSLPSAQWTVVTEDANFKFYATAAIPTSLYRFSKDPENLGTGPLALNFGVLSRLTWLDRDGHEGIVGLESGVMAMGLETNKDRQLAVVAGLGVSVPLGNANQPTQAAVNIHSWVSYTIGEHDANLTDSKGTVTGTVPLNHWAFVFGPSITIGSVGTFL